MNRQEESREHSLQQDSEELSIQRAIMELVGKPSYRPVKAKTIAKRLRVSKDKVGLVKQAIKDLVQRGLLAYEPQRRVRMADMSRPSGNRVVGVFRRAEGGYGFVRPRTSGDEQPPDVFIPARYTGDAATGDVVLVELVRRRGSAGLRGRVIEVLERQTKRFVGSYFRWNNAGFVEVDGGLFSRPVYVGDPGAKGAQIDDKVVIEMIRFPTAFHDGEGVIVEVLGRAGQPGVDTRMIMREFGLPEEFPEDVLDQARQVAQNFEETVPENRLDLTALTTITIDPVDARDFDDAISLQRLPGGHWRLGVHIADVSHFVPARSPLDREAYRRATSVYLPDRVIPMLPELISNGVASLQPGKIRYTKTVFIEFDPEGIPVDCQIHRSAIKSRRRLAYQQVDQFLENPTPWRRRLGAKVFNLLGEMHQLAMILRRRRLARGALELTLPEVKVDLDRQGRVVGAHVIHHTESHQIIEEFMLAANQAVAQFLEDRGLAFLRRVHKDPMLRKLRELSDFVSGLGLGGDSLQSRFALQKLLTAVAGRPEQYAVNYAVLRSLQRAVYSPRPEGHFALAAETYCHFTSPIRRYPDLTIHRMLDAVLAGKRPPYDFDHLASIGEHCSQCEERAEQAERELIKLKLLGYLAERIGMELEAVITGVERFGLFVQGIQLPAEGLVHVSSLPPDQYRYDRAAHCIEGFRSGNRFRLGDVVRVVVAAVDLDRRQLDFRLVQATGSKRGAGASGEVAGTVSKPVAAPGKRARRTARAKTAAQPPAGKSTGRKSPKRTRKHK